MLHASTATGLLFCATTIKRAGAFSFRIVEARMWFVSVWIVANMRTRRDAVREGT